MVEASRVVKYVETMVLAGMMLIAVDTTVLAGGVETMVVV